MTLDEELTMLDLGADTFAYERGSGVRCIVNMGDEPVAISGELLVASEPGTTTSLAPDAAVWLR